MTMYQAGLRQVAGRDAPEIADLGQMLGHIGREHGASRADLARLTGRSRSTVTQRVETLLELGLVTEAGFAPSGGGRKGQLLRLNAGLGVIQTADLGATQARLAVSDFAGTELEARTEDLMIDQAPAQVLGRVDELLGGLLTRTGRDARDVLITVVGLPAPVEFSTGTAVKPPLMPGWDGYSVPDYFAGRQYPLGTVVDNDVNLMALGEHTRNQAYSSLDNLLFIKIGTGIGCGIIVDRQLYRGANGAAGDIGHIRVPGADDLCRCGNLGCLEAVASGHALAQRLAPARPGTTTARDVVALAAAGDSQARQYIRVAGQHIGEVLAALVSFANPSAIVLGGTLAHSDQALLAGIRSGIYDRALPLATRALPIETSKLEDRAGTEGAIALAQQRALSAGGITALLRHRAR